MRAESGAGPGWARLDTTDGLQAPAFPPSSCLFFPFPDMLIFHRPSQKLSQGWGQAMARVSSGLAAPPPSSHLPLPGWLEPPTPCIPGSRGNPGYEFRPQGPGSCPDPQGPRCPIALFPWPAPLLPGTTQPRLPGASLPPTPRLCEDWTCLVHLPRLVPAHI